MTQIHTIPFHIGDFISGTLGLDATETGAYAMLLFAHYEAGVGGLPNDDKQLGRIAKCSPKQWGRVRERVMGKFTLIDNFWRSSKVIEVIQKVHSISANNRAKALNRHGSNDASAEPAQSNPEAINQKPINKGKKGNKARPPAEPLPTPEEFGLILDQTKWAAFLKIRPKKKNTPESIREVLETLEKMKAQGHDPNERLSYSIAGGYPGIYWPNPPRAHAPDNRSTLSRAGDRLRESLQRPESGYQPPPDNPF